MKMTKTLRQTTALLCVSALAGLFVACEAPQREAGQGGGPDATIERTERPDPRMNEPYGGGSAEENQRQRVHTPPTEPEMREQGQPEPGARNPMPESQADDSTPQAGQQQSNMQQDSMQQGDMPPADMQQDSATGGGPAGTSERLERGRQQVQQGLEELRQAAEEAARDGDAEIRDAAEDLQESAREAREEIERDIKEVERHLPARSQPQQPSQSEQPLPQDGTGQ